MKVNSKNKCISFNGFWNNKSVKNTLRFAEKNGALFTASTTLAFSSLIRPLAILSTPKTDKENKKIACAKSLMSSILEFAITLGISLPLVKSIGKINKSPQKYLKTETINFYKSNLKNLENSKSYTFVTQSLKLGIGLAITAPKAILTALGMPYIYTAFNRTDVDKNDNQNVDKEKQLTFKGKFDETLSTSIGKILDNKGVQKLSSKYKNSNFPMHIIAMKDIMATLLFVNQVQNSDKVQNDRKSPLINNSLISTGLSLVVSYIVDSMTEKSSQKIINKIRKENINDKNVEKYVKGFQIAKPALIIATIYYLFIPIVSTFLAERISINKNSKSN